MVEMKRPWTGSRASVVSSTLDGAFFRNSGDFPVGASELVAQGGMAPFLALRAMRESASRNLWFHHFQAHPSHPNVGLVLNFHFNGVYSVHCVLIRQVVFKAFEPRLSVPDNAS